MNQRRHHPAADGRAHRRHVAQPLEALPHILAGEMKYVVAVGEKRLAELPDIPTLSELGYDVKLTHAPPYLGPPGMVPAGDRLTGDALKKGL